MKEEEMNKLIERYIDTSNEQLRDVIVAGARCAFTAAYRRGMEETKRKAIEALPERKNIGYGEGLEEPNIIDEIQADFYDTKSEAWFAGWDKYQEQALLAIGEITL